MLRLRHTLGLFALAAALLPLSAAAVPNDTTDTTSDLSEDVLERARLMHLLNSDSQEEQERAVRLINTYAHTGRYDSDFFALTVTPLHALAAQGSSEGLQIMAISALSSIGTDVALQGLATLIHDLESDRVKAVARTAVRASKDPRVAARNQNP